MLGTIVCMSETRYIRSVDLYPSDGKMCSFLDRSLTVGAPLLQSTGPVESRRRAPTVREWVCFFYLISALNVAIFLHVLRLLVAGFGTDRSTV